MATQISLFPPQWSIAEAEIKDPSVDYPGSKVLPLKLEVGHYIAIHATPTVRDFFLPNFYLPGPFTLICSQTSQNLFLC